MSKTFKQSIQILDNRSQIRTDFLKKWFANNIDVLRFYHFSAKQSKIPILGTYLIRSNLNLYYRYFHTNSIILPLIEIEGIINHSTHLYIDPCICRVECDNCDAPIYACLRINFAAQLRQEETKSKGLSKKEAINIVRNARKHGLVFSLEQCIQPYQYNICMCCSCCCLAWRFRYQYGLDVYHSSPYLPEIEEAACNDCQECVQKCPTNSISFTNNKPKVDVENCLGCGICEEICPEKTIAMVKNRVLKRKDTEPGPIRLYLSKMYLYLNMIPLVTIFKLLRGSHQFKLENVNPKPKDVYRK